MQADVCSVSVFSFSFCTFYYLIKTTMTKKPTQIGLYTGKGVFFFFFDLTFFIVDNFAAPLPTPPFFFLNSFLSFLDLVDVCWSNHETQKWPFFILKVMWFQKYQERRRSRQLSGLKKVAWRTERLIKIFHRQVGILERELGCLWVEEYIEV